MARGRGIHTHNGSVDLADLHRYTVELYPELDRVSGQDCGIHLTGGSQPARRGGPYKYECF